MIWVPFVTNATLRTEFEWPTQDVLKTLVHVNASMYTFECLDAGVVCQRPELYGAVSTATDENLSSERKVSTNRITASITEK